MLKFKKANKTEKVEAVNTVEVPCPVCKGEWEGCTRCGGNGKVFASTITPEETE